MTSDEQIDDAIGAFQWRTLDDDGTITTCAAELMVFARAVIAAESCANQFGGCLKTGKEKAMGLQEHYADLAVIWRWAARAYAERAVRSEGYDPSKRVEWNDLAVRATHRASRYARLAAAT